MAQFILDWRGDIGLGPLFVALDQAFPKARFRTFVAAFAWVAVALDDRRSSAMN